MDTLDLIISTMPLWIGIIAMAAITWRPVRDVVNGACYTLFVLLLLVVGYTKFIYTCNEQCQVELHQYDDYP